MQMVSGDNLSPARWSTISLGPVLVVISISASRRLSPNPVFSVQPPAPMVTLLPSPLRDPPWIAKSIRQTSLPIVCLFLNVYIAYVYLFLLWFVEFPIPPNYQITVEGVVLFIYFLMPPGG